jgi:maltooligosyltrehalose trehalohydrolase
MLLEYYRKLILLRREIPALAKLDKNTLEVTGNENQRTILLRRWHQAGQIFCVMNFNTDPVQISANLPPGNWPKLIDSADKFWGGAGSSLPGTLSTGQEFTIEGLSLALFAREDAS